MYAGHQLGMLGILLVVLQQKLASLFIQSRLWKGLYQQTPAATTLWRISNNPVCMTSRQYLFLFAILCAVILSVHLPSVSGETAIGVPLVLCQIGTWGTHQHFAVATL